MGMSLLTQNDIYKHEIVISLSMVKPRSKRKLKMFLKLILAKLLFDIQSLLYCSNLIKKKKKKIVNKSHKVLFFAFLCVQLHVLL